MIYVGKMCINLWHLTVIVIFYCKVLQCYIYIDVYVRIATYLPLMCLALIVDFIPLDLIIKYSSESLVLNLQSQPHTHRTADLSNIPHNIFRKIGYVLNGMQHEVFVNVSKATSQRRVTIHILSKKLNDILCEKDISIIHQMLIDNTLIDYRMLYIEFSILSRLNFVPILCLIWI